MIWLLLGTHATPTYVVSEDFDRVDDVASTTCMSSVAGFAPPMLQVPMFAYVLAFHTMT